MKKNKTLKIFGYGWHCAHQHDLLKLPNTEWFYIKNRIKPAWQEANRPYPKNMTEVTHYTPGEYDLAVLHIDQQCLFGHPKGIPYKELDKAIQDIPKIVINHGTPHYQDYPPEFIRERMREVIGKNTMLVNSVESQKEWGFGEVIIHGMDPEEWTPRPKVKRVVTVMSPGHPKGNHDLDGWAEYYGRELYDEIRKRLKKLNIETVHVGKDITFTNWKDYKEYLAESLIYLNPTRFSPMPRSRTEAMLSGCAIVTTPYHDADIIFADRINGAIFETADQAVGIIKNLIETPEAAEKMGLNGRAVAMICFGYDRYHQQWQWLIDKVLTNHRYTNESKILKARFKELAEMLWNAVQGGYNVSDGTLDNVLNDILAAHEARLRAADTSKHTKQ
jgi:glycosyltransferase involved in cell wall biosynthesis